MNVANEAIILELASTDRTLLEWGDSRGTADNPSHFSNFNIIRCSNCHRLGHVARYYSSLPTRPLVEICIEGVNVVALLDTRVGQGFGVYGIQGLFKSGMRYISAEIWVFGISRFLNFRYKVYLPFLSL